MRRDYPRREANERCRRAWVASTRAVKAAHPSARWKGAGKGRGTWSIDLTLPGWFDNIDMSGAELTG